MKNLFVVSVFVLGLTASPMVAAETSKSWSQSGAQAMEDDRPANSVVPTLSMKEQLLPCLSPKADQTLVKVNIRNLGSYEGNVRVQVYGDNPDDFLSKGKKLKRVDVAIDPHGEDVALCIPLPKVGQYAFVALHDMDANGRANFLTEGFGFSNNPRLFLSPPDHEDVVVAVRSGVQELDIEMNYVSPTSKKDRHRRQRR